MTEDEHRAALMALLRWLQSQSIEPHDAVPLLCSTISIIVSQLAVQGDMNAMDGGRAAGDMIMDCLK